MLIRDAHAEFFRWLIANRSPAVVSHYKADCHMLIQRLGGADLKTIAPKTIDDTLAATPDRFLRFARLFFGWAVDYDHTEITNLPNGLYRAQKAYERRPHDDPRNLCRPDQPGGEN